jgi:hypothetical protein
MNDLLYCLVLEKLLEETNINEFSGVGAIGGVATPLGAGPSGKVSYKDENSKSDSSYKKKKKKVKSPSWHLKNNNKKKIQEQNSTECLNSGAQFHISVRPESVSIDVDFPFELSMQEQDAIEMETLLHNAVELVLSRYWI